MTGGSNPLRRAAVFVAVLAIVTQAVMAAPATAATTSGSTTVQPSLQPDCGESQLEKAVQFLSPAYALYDAVNGGDECDMETVLQGNQEQEMQDIHANAQTLSTDQQSTITAYTNALNDARTVAWTEAECATLDALEANRSQEVTRQWARENITRYYSRMETNVVADFQSKISRLAYLGQVKQNESLDSSILTTAPTYPSTIGSDHDINGISNWSVGSQSTTIPLSNGSNTTLQTVELEVYSSSDGTEYVPVSWYIDDRTDDVRQLRFESSYNNSTVVALDLYPYYQVMQDIESQNTQMLSNANTTVNGLYGSYVRGNLNVSDYRSVQCTADSVGVGVNSTYYSIYAVSALAKAGAEVPDLNQTGSITIESSQFVVNGSNETLTGLLVSSEVPNNSWTVGQTYDPAAINGSQSFHVEASNRSMYLEEPFTIVGMTDENGDNVSSVNTTEYNYRTDNFSELSTKLDRLIELREEEQVRIEEASTGGDGGGFGWPDIGGAELGGISIVLLGGVALLLFASDRLPI